MRILTRIAALFRARRLDAELEGEIQAHLELAEREALDAGHPLAEARNAARRSFGNRTLIQETAHTMNPVSILEAAARDLRHGLRSINRNPRYAAMIALTLAICIGANTAIFSAVYSVLLRPLPVPNADRIVLMANLYPKAGVGMIGQSSGGDYYDRMRDVTALEDQAMMREATQILDTGGSSERIVVARTSVRTKEMGTRLALGAGMGRLTNQLVAENVVLAVAGGALGLGVASVLIRSLAAIGLDGFPRAGEVRIDATVAFFAVALSVLAGLAIALFSVAYLSRLSVTGALAGSSRTSTSGHGIGALRKGLVVVQVGLTFVLLTGAAQMLASFRELVRVKPGYRTEGVLTVTTLAPSSAYPDSVGGLALADRILGAIRPLPGVVRAGIVNQVPLSGVYNDSVIVAEGHTMRPGESVMSPIYSAATPGYFEAMDIRILSGRGFEEHDRRESRRVIVIDKKLADRSWPGRDAVGRRMFQPQSPDLRTNERTEWITVVGVVDTVRILNLAGTDNDAGVYYLPFSQNFSRTFTVAIHTSGDPQSLAAPVRAAIAKIDPALALFDVRTMADRAAASLAARRAALILSLSFGTISLFLAAIGLYGVLSYLLAQRTREIGIRMAVGSTPAGVFGLFFKEGAVLVGIGLVAGAGLAVAVRGAIERFLYGVRPLEPAVLVGVILTLACIAFLAIAWPARQAAKMNPTAALRAEG